MTTFTGSAQDPAQTPVRPGLPFPQPLIEAFRRQPDVPAFRHRSRDVLRGEVLELTARCVTGLRDAGLGPGHSVALDTGVSPEGFAVQIAAHLLGCRVTGLRPGLTPVQLTAVLRGDTDAVVTDDPAARPGLSEAAGGAAVLRVPDLLDAPPAPEDGLVARGRPDDAAVVYLTSGSTGTPKGCVQTYRSLSAHYSWQPARWTERTSRLAAGYGRFLLFGTLASAVMFEHLGLCLLGGGTAVIPEPPLEFPQVFERERVTACLMTVPRLYRLLDALRTGQTGTSSLRALTVAGSPLPPHRLAEAAGRLGGAVHQAYGQTEAWMLTLLTPEDIAAGPPEVLGSVGRPWVGVEVRVRDGEGRELPAGEQGEVWVRTDGQTSGYWRDEEQTRQILHEGWLRTRDLGYLDERGFLYLTGRTRDVVLVNAVLHHTGAMEQVLAAHPDIDEAHVVGAPDEHTGEAAHAFVVAVAGRTPDPAALRAFVAQRLGEESVPATITAVPEVPVAPSGKPDKHALLSWVLPR